MDLPNIVAYLEHPDTCDDGYSPEFVDLPWPIPAESFLRCAKDDLTSSLEHRHINALSNAKRALHNRVDSLLFAYGLLATAEKTSAGFPRRLELLEQIGLLTPRVLRKLNSQRNILEHDYARPTDDRVEDLVDVVALFIEATNKYVRRFVAQADFENETLAPPAWIHISMSAGSGRMKIAAHEKSGTHEVDSCSLSVLEQQAEYIRVVRAMLAALEAGHSW